MPKTAAKANKPEPEYAIEEHQNPAANTYELEAPVHDWVTPKIKKSTIADKPEAPVHDGVTRKTAASVGEPDAPVHD